MNQTPLDRLPFFIGKSISPKEIHKGERGQHSREKKLSYKTFYFAEHYTALMFVVINYSIYIHSVDYAEWSCFPKFFFIRELPLQSIHFVLWTKQCGRFGVVSCSSNKFIHWTVVQDHLTSFIILQSWQSTWSPQWSMALAMNVFVH